MSATAMTWVLEHSSAKGTDRLVLLVLAKYVKPDAQKGAWDAWPSVATIQAEAGLDRSRTVQESLARLEAAGAVVRVLNAAPEDKFRADRRPNLYRLIVADGVTSNGKAPRRPRGAASRPNGVTDNAERGDASQQNGVTPDSTTGCRETSPKGFRSKGKQQREQQRNYALVPSAERRPNCRWSDLADDVTRAFWESQETKPVCGFVAVRERVQEALEAGYGAEQVAAALPTMPAYTRNAFDYALTHPAPRAKPSTAVERARNTHEAIARVLL